MQQKTWLKRFQQFLFCNNLTLQFSKNFEDFLKYFKNDFINEQEQFGLQLIDHLNFDKDFKLYLQRVNRTAIMLIEILFRIGFYNENLLQEYMNK